MKIANLTLNNVQLKMSYLNKIMLHFEHHGIELYCITKKKILSEKREKERKEKIHQNFRTNFPLWG